MTSKRPDDGRGHRGAETRGRVVSKKNVAEWNARHTPVLDEVQLEAWDPRDAGRLVPRPRAEYAELARYIEAEDPDGEEWNERITRAWHLVTLDILEGHGLLPAAAEAMIAILRAQEGVNDIPYIAPAEALNDPQNRAAFDVVYVALEHIAGRRGRGADVMRMAQAIERSPEVRRREAICEAMAWTADDRRCHEYAADSDWLDHEVDDEEEPDQSPAQRQRALRAAVINHWLRNVDLRLELPSDVAEALLKRHDRINSANHLAADWAWRSGLEGKPEAGESLTDDAPDRIVKLYSDRNVRDRMRAWRAGKRSGRVAPKPAKKATKKKKKTTRNR